MKALDILWLLLLIWGAYNGFRRGFVVEICSISTCLIAIIGIVKVLGLHTQLLQKWTITKEHVAFYTILILVAIAIVCTVKMLGRVVSSWIHMTFFKGIDMLLGATLGILKWLVVIALFLGLAHTFQLDIPYSYLGDTYFLRLIQHATPHW